MAVIDTEGIGDAVTQTTDRALRCGAGDRDDLGEALRTGDIDIDAFGRRAFAGVGPREGDLVDSCLRGEPIGRVHALHWAVGGGG